MTFRNRSWHDRFKQMGDEAEAAFEKYMQKAKRGFVRWGLERPPLRVAALPLRIRHAPDYLTTRAFVECQGFGNDRTVKLKVEKLDVLAWWNTVHPVELFLWDSTNETHVIVPLECIHTLRDTKGVTLDWFPEGKAYFAIDAEVLYASAA